MSSFNENVVDQPSSGYHVKPLRCVQLFITVNILNLINFTFNENVVD